MLFALACSSSPAPAFHLPVANLLFIFSIEFYWKQKVWRKQVIYRRYLWVNFEPSKEQQKKRLRISKTINWIVMQQSKWKQRDRKKWRSLRTRQEFRCYQTPFIYQSCDVDERRQNSCTYNHRFYYLFDESILYTFIFNSIIQFFVTSRTNKKAIAFNWRKAKIKSHTHKNRKQRIR